MFAITQNMTSYVKLPLLRPSFRDFYKKKMAIFLYLGGEICLRENGKSEPNYHSTKDRKDKVGP